MKIGIVDDGQASSQALYEMLRRSIASGSLLRPLYADMQPRAKPGQIVRAASPKIKILQQRGATKILLTIDLEDDSQCPTAFSKAIKDALKAQNMPDVEVVIKKYCFENWLIADLDALESLPGTFRLTDRIKGRIKASGADAERKPLDLLNAVRLGDRRYHKATDGMSIAKNFDALRAATNSRSFRRFLRVLGHPHYATQSREPHQQRGTGRRT